MKFPTMYDRQKEVSEFQSDCGSPIKTTYRYEVVRGKKYLVPDGSEDIQAQIDAFGEIQDIHAILQRFMNGDVSVLNQRQGAYFDSTKMPTSYAEMYDLIENGKEFFSTLPPDVQKEFENNPFEFFSSMDSPSFGDRIAKYMPQESVSESEVKDSAE